MILTNQLVSGQKLNQQRLAERLGVSRTPLLLAFSKLEKEMLLDIIPRRGAYVKSFSLKEFEDLYALRLKLEPLGASEAATRGSDEQIKELKNALVNFDHVARDSASGSIRQADYDFHMAIMRMSQNDLLHRVMSSFNIIIIANLKGLLLDPMKSLLEHEEIFDAISNRTEKMAEKLMYRHIHDAARRLKDLVFDGEDQ